MGGRRNTFNHGRVPSSDGPNLPKVPVQLTEFAARWDWRWRRALALVFAFMGFLADPSGAFGREPGSVSDLALGVGEISSLSDWPRSFSLALSYRHTFSPHFSTTLAYLNHGHFPGHHRDGVAGEAWLQQDVGSFTLAAGAGYFYYFDTTVAAHGGGFSDDHGWAPMASLSLMKPLGRRSFLELRLDHTAPSQSIETNSATLLWGSHLTPDTREPDHHDDGVYHAWEATLYGGKTVVNSLHSPSSLALSGEARYAFGDYVRGSVAVLNEGNAELIRRNGLLVEGWLEPGFSGDSFSVGVGLGAYSAIDKYRPAPGRHLSGVVSLTLSKRLPSNWDVRVDWHRIVTDYDRDTDIILGGVGYQFR